MSELKSSEDLVNEWAALIDKQTAAMKEKTEVIVTATARATIKMIEDGAADLHSRYVSFVANIKFLDKLITQGAQIDPAELDMIHELLATSMKLVSDEMASLSSSDSDSSGQPT